MNDPHSSSDLNAASPQKKRTAIDKTVLKDSSIGQSNCSTYTCDLCNAKYTTSKSLQRHKQQQRHGAVFHTPKTNTFCCSECEESLKSYTAIIKHYQERHEDIKIEKETLCFATRSAYQEWKEEMEQQTASKFVNASQGSHSKVKKPDCVYEYFSCNRSGIFVSNIKKRERSMKKTGSIKMGRFCPARITVHTLLSETETKLCVKFTSTHLGHDHRPYCRRLSLPQTEKRVPTGQLLMGTSKEPVLQGDDEQNECAAMTLDLRRSTDLQTCDELKAEIDSLLSKIALISEMSTNEGLVLLIEGLKQVISEWEAKRHAEKDTKLPTTLDSLPTNKKTKLQRTLFVFKKKEASKTFKSSAHHHGICFADDDDHLHVNQATGH